MKLQAYCPPTETSQLICTAQTFSCFFFEIFKNTSFMERLRWLLLTIIGTIKEAFIQEKEITRTRNVFRQRLLNFTSNVKRI